MRVERSHVEGKTFDLCIVGSGPAGITLALEYERLYPDRTILLVEFGGVKPESGDNRLDETIEITNPVNHHPPDECTNKGLGGTSATWGGRCVMYDEIDFMDRPVLQGECTWSPALLRDVEKFVPRAAEIFECGSGAFQLPKSSSTRLAEGLLEGPITDTVVERWSMPTRFGKRYRAEIENSSAISLLLRCEARTLKVGGTGRVEAMEFRETGTGACVTVHSRSFVLAAGAQESTRLLLRNPAVFHRLSAVPPALGKYYQGHVSGKIASVRFSGNPRHTEYGFRQDEDGVYSRRRLQLSTEALLAGDLLNTALWLDNPPYFDPSHRSGAMSFMYLAMITPVLGPKLAPPAVAHSVTKGKVFKVGRHLLNILRGLPGSLAIPASIFFRRYCLTRQLPGVFLYNPQNRYALHFHGEQVPHSENRMELAPDGETLVIHYALTDRDINSVIRVHETLDAWLRECGCGELEYWFSPDELPAAIREMSRDGIHQVATTRIGPDPERGVVDENLRVWGTENLFVCSSSAFPTSGQANPTFLLGAFAVRLAHHLN